MRIPLNGLAGCACAVLTALLGLALATEVRAEEGASPAAKSSEAQKPSESERIEELEEKVDILTEEVGRLEAIFAVPEELQLVSVNGLGPAASKVYKRESGLSIGGYGEVLLRSFMNQDDDDQDDIVDALRAILYVGYKFNENWVINSELEFEHGGTGAGGSVSTEFLTVDYLWRDEVNVRTGLVLVPMGFVNEIHEPNFFFGAQRPEIERTILPSTWREVGAGLYGTIAERVEYRAYVINGFDGRGFTSSGLRGGRQSGGEALANDFAFVGRVDVDVLPGLEVGGSVYTGQSGQEQDFDTDGAGPNPSRSLPDAQTTIYELHLQFKRYGASVRGLWTEAFIDEAGRLSRVLGKGAGSSIAQHMRGWYVEAAYDVMPLLHRETKMSLEPFFRFEKYDTQEDVSDLGFTRDEMQDIELYTAGLQFKPIPQVVFKLDYRHFDPADGHRADQVQGLVGYVF